MAEGYSLVETVVEVLHDGAKGFADIGEHFKNPELKTYFLQEAQHRASFASELQTELASVGGSKDIGGTVSGAVHRAWGDLKANLGGTDHTLLETAEQGEDAAKKAYKEALEGEIPSATLRSTLLRQQQHIQASHDKVKAYRDTLPS
jgi:uncharacterized protein (TIGR02284 family)